MARPKDMPTEFPHGTRSRYVAQKCRCDECRKANRDYAAALAKKKVDGVLKISVPLKYKDIQKPIFGRMQTVRVRTCPGFGDQPCPTDARLRKDTKGGLCGTCRGKAVYDGMVPAKKARARLRHLSKHGMGNRTVADAAGVALSVILKIVSGERTQIRLATETRILEVTLDARADHALIPASPTHRLIKKLRKLGFSTMELAEELGIACVNNLYMKHDQVTVARAAQIEKIYRRELAAHKDERRLARHLARLELCHECGLSHAPVERQARVRRMLPCTAREIVEAYPCTYSLTRQDRGHGQESRMAFRDLRAIGAEPRGFIWYPRADPENG